MLLVSSNIVIACKEDKEDEEEDPLAPMITWKDFLRLMPWEIVILVGAGYALAAGCKVGQEYKNLAHKNGDVNVNVKCHCVHSVLCVGVRFVHVDWAPAGADEWPATMGCHSTSLLACVCCDRIRQQPCHSHCVPAHHFHLGKNAQARVHKGSMCRLL